MTERGAAVAKERTSRTGPMPDGPAATCRARFPFVTRTRWPVAARRALLATLLALTFLLSGCHAPLEPDNLGQWFFLDMGPGEEESETFSVSKDYERMSLNYNFTNVSHVRLWVVAPDDTEHPTTIDASGLPALNLTSPARGTWTFHIATLNETTRQGHVDFAIVWFLGFVPGAVAPTEKPTRSPG